MPEKKDIFQVAGKLNKWVTSENFIGWDIYDGLNSEKTQKIKNFYLKLLTIQINKYSPVNFRSILQIKKDKDLKGITLFSQSYSNMFAKSGEKIWCDNLVYTLDIIKNSSLKKTYGNDCWASHYFPYIGVDKSTLSPTTPDIIGTSNAIIALIKGYKILQSPELKESAISGANFLIKNLFEESEKYPFFRYSSLEQTKNSITLNASAQALEALSAVYPYLQNFDSMNICQKVSTFLIEQQRNDGSWNYSMYPDGRTKRKQLDFHQGYMIDGLLAFLPYSEKPEILEACIKSGAQYYRTKLFRQNGTSYYRYPLPFPIDIHNQSQGIITFSKMSLLDSSYLNFAKIIADWTITNMQDTEGFFYYQKWPVFTNKIPHMRWGQAWMMLALSQLLQSLGVSYD